jgi:CelD/BcsL family acetyltransferase involved in cellulose biosynthesis
VKATGVTAAGVSVRVARSIEELEPLRGAWDRLRGHHVTADPDHYRAVLDATAGARPHAVLVERDGEPVALALGRVEDFTLPVRLGYRVILSPKLRALTLVYGGMMGDADEETARTVLAELRGALSRGEADVLRLRMLEVGTPLHVLAHSEPGAFLRPRFARPSVHYQVAIPGSLDDFLAERSYKTRRNLRYYDRRLVAQLGDRLTMRTFADPAEIDRLFADTLQVSAKTYQHAIGASFVDSPVQRAVFELGLRSGWLRAYVLYVGERPIAFWHGSAYRGVLGPGMTGYDPEFHEVRAGSYVLVRRIEDACADPEITLLDWGFGDAEYKRSLSDRSWVEEDLLVFAPSWKGIRANLGRTGVLAAGELLRRAQRNGKLAAAAKRRWRKGLRKTGSEAAG